MQELKEMTIDFDTIREKREQLDEEQLNEFLFSWSTALGGTVKVLLGMMGMGDNFGVPVKSKVQEKK